MRLSTKKAQQIVETLLLLAGAIGVLLYFTRAGGSYRNTVKISINRVVDNIYEAHRWDVGPWNACPASCGATGTRTRTVNCVDASGAVVADSNCEGDKPATSEPCDPGPCTGYNWRIGDWGPCLPNCGAVRAQTRTVECIRFPDGTPVAAANCPNPDPPTTQACAPQTNCGVWNQTCDACPACGNAVTVNCTVQCFMGLTHVPDSYCDSGARPPGSFDCVGLPQCYYWQFPADPEAGWGACSLACGGGTQTREAICYDGATATPTGDQDCIDYGLSKPTDESRACNAFICQCLALPPDRAWCPGADTNVPASMHGSYFYVGPDSSYCTGSKCEAYCVPTDTCASAGLNCGTLNTGCGTTEDCGTCVPNIRDQFSHCQGSLLAVFDQVGDYCSGTVGTCVTTIIQNDYRTDTCENTRPSGSIICIEECEPGGCHRECVPWTTPYLFVRVDGKYVIENDVLFTYFNPYYENAKQWYETNKPEKFGYQPTDYYKLRLLPDVEADGIHLRIKEIEPEESHIDQVKLVRVLYDQDAHLITDHQTNEIRVVKRQLHKRMTSCRFNDEGCLDILEKMDSRYFNGDRGDELNVEFDVTGLKEKEQIYLMLNGWGWVTSPLQTVPLKVEGGHSFRTFLYDIENTGHYIEIKRTHPREIESDHYLEVTDMVKKLKGNTLGVRIEWTREHAMDFLALMTAEEVDFRSEDLELLKADHSRDGNVLEQMSLIDYRYADTFTGATIDLLFAKPALGKGPGEQEGYILITSGFYHGLRTFLYPDLADESGEWRKEINAHIEDLSELIKAKKIDRSIAVDYYHKKIYH